MQLLNLASDSWMEAVGGGREGRQREREGRRLRAESEGRRRERGRERQRDGKNWGGAKKEKLRRDSCQHICY